MVSTNPRFQPKLAAFKGNHHYSDFYPRLIEVKEWFEEIGINTSGTRLDSMIEEMKFMRDEYMKFLDDKSHKIKVSPGELVNSAYEATSLIGIRSVFIKLNQSRLPIEKLKNSIRGPINAIAENTTASTNYARNRLYELETAANFYHWGFDLFGYDDVNFNIDLFEVNIECKRPFTLFSVPRNIEYAYNQMVRNNQLNGRNKKGIIAISFEKIYGLDKFMVARNEEHLNEIMNGYIDDFSSRFESYWKKYEGSNLIALLFSFKSSVFYTERNQYSSFTGNNLIPIIDLDKFSIKHPNKIICNTIADKMLNENTPYHYT